MNRSVAPTYTQNFKKNSRISATLFRWCPIFIFSQTFFNPLAGLWCPCWTGGAPGTPVVLLLQGRIQKNSKGRVMNRSGAPTYTQNSKSQRISATLLRWCPTFSFFQTVLKARGAPGRSVVPLTGAPARQVAGLRSRSRSRPESVVLTGVGVGVRVCKFSSTPTPARSRSRLQDFFIISLLFKKETEIKQNITC